MSEEENKPELAEDGAPKEPVAYASPMKRIWAWVGVAYMVIVVLLMTYMISFGAYLKGIGALMICPALVGAAVSAALLWRRGEGRKTMTNRLVLAVIIGLCGALVLMNLWNGIPALIANFGA